MSSHISEPAADDGSALTREGAEPATVAPSFRGASPSNTAPPNYIPPSDTEIIRTGVDSLYVSYQGSIEAHIQSDLERKKELARSENVEDKAQALLHLLDHQFEVRPNGKGRFPFVLVDNWFHLQLASAAAKSLPMMYAQVSSELLTRSGLNSVFSPMTGLARSLDSESSSHSISRVDLCVDFVTDHPIERIADVDWVTRAKSIDRYTHARQFTGYTIGRGGGLSCRLYDKTLEIDQRSKKLYLFEVWMESGWDGRFPVWRLEYQFRRDVLRELGIESFQDLEGSLNSLWKYATEQWLRLTIPSGDSNQSRWPIHPLWFELSQATFNPLPREPLTRVRKERVPSDEYLFRNGIGPITSFMAREGFSNIDLALPVFLAKALEYHETLRRTTGKDLIEYARVRSEEKSRRYNKVRNPMASFSAEDYRRRRDGETDDR